MAEKVDRREEITSADAGLRFTWFADRRRGLGTAFKGIERRRSIVSTEE